MFSMLRFTSPQKRSVVRAEHSVASVMDHFRVKRSVVRAKHSIVRAKCSVVRAKRSVARAKHSIV